MVKDLCFEIIETCLNNCLFCSSKSNCKKNQIIDFDDFKKVIDYFMSNGGIEEISFSGGEPFLHPNLIEMVKYVKSYKIRTVIFTSGVTYGSCLKDDEKNWLIGKMNEDLQEIEKHEPYNDFLKGKVKKYYMQMIQPKKVSPLNRSILKNLKTIGLDKIVFDFQAYELDTDKYLMGRDENSRQALLESLLNSTLEKLDVDVHFIPMIPNYKEISDILELIEIAKVPNISILKFIPQGRGKENKDNLLLTEEKLNDFFEILNCAKKHYSGNIRIGIPLQSEAFHKCNAGLEKLDIKFDGTILPCPAFKEITKEECEKFNIKLTSIYDDLEKTKILGQGTRVEPLCKQIYDARKK